MAKTKVRVKDIPILKRPKREPKVVLAPNTSVEVAAIPKPESSPDEGWRPPLIEREKRTEKDLIQQLAALGHLDEDPHGISFDSKAVETAVISYQDFHGLNVDGDLGPITAAHMSRPRCGLADILPARNCESKWGFLDVMYSHRLIFDSMSAEDIHKAVVDAVSQWNAVCALRLTFQQEMTTANIWMQARAIDQSGGTLAWSYLPGCGSGKSVRIEQRYDTREQWRRDFLIAVVTHEVGHALGLEHSTEPNLMAPFYNPSVTKPQSGDIAEVVRRYGAFVPPGTVPPVGPVPPGVPPGTPPTVPPTNPADMLAMVSYNGINFVGALARR